MHTKDHLAQELRKAGLDEMAGRAERGFYHDFMSPLDDPAIQLASELRVVGTPEAEALRKRHLNGEFDATTEESEEWAASAEGRETMAQLIRERGHPERDPHAETIEEKFVTAGIDPVKGERRLGDGPIEVKFEDLMNSVAFALDQILNGNDVMQNPSKRRNGFVLLVFPFGEKQGRCNYISNGADRDDIIKLFREQIKRFEEQTEKPK